MWKQLSSKTIFHHPRLTLVEDVVQLPDGKEVPYLLFEHTNHSVTVLCLNDGKILLQQEYSYPTREVLHQFPGGKIEPEENPEKAALRELFEESGCVAKKLTEIGWYYVNNRRSAAKMYVYIAEDITQEEKRGGDIEEDITSMWVLSETIDTMISQGEIVNYSVLAAWSLFRNKKN